MKLLAIRLGEQKTLAKSLVMRNSVAGSGGARTPHILMCMLRVLCSGLTRHRTARYDFCHYVECPEWRRDWPGRLLAALLFFASIP